MNQKSDAQNQDEQSQNTQARDEKTPTENAPSEQVDYVAARQQTAGGQLLSAQLVFEISSLEMRARAVGEGVLVGIHQSRRFGSSSEFAEHKLYAPGDDLRHLDWKAFARKDRFYVRRYQEEINLDVLIVVDTSASMAYAGGARGRYGVSKMNYAATLAAAVAYVAARRSDAPGLSLAAGDELLYLPPRARLDAWSELLKRLEETYAEGKSGIADVLQAVANRMARRSLVVVISDLLDVGEQIIPPLRQIRQRGSDVVILHVLDRDELEFPFDGVVRFEDMEGDREAQVDAPAVRAAYLEELRAFLDGIQRGADRSDLRYCQVITDESPAAVLRTALSDALFRGR